MKQLVISSISKERASVKFLRLDFSIRVINTVLRFKIQDVHAHSLSLKQLDLDLSF